MGAQVDRREKALAITLSLLKKREFRTLLHAKTVAGEQPIIAADIDDNLHDLLHEVGDRGGAANVVALHHDQLAVISMCLQRGAVQEVQPVGEGATLGFLLDTIIFTERGKTEKTMTICMSGSCADTDLAVSRGELVAVT